MTQKDLISHMFTVRLVVSLSPRLLVVICVLPLFGLRNGQGQSVVASRAIAAAIVSGSWVLLQNCHLGLDYMETMEDYLQVCRTK